MKVLLNDTSVLLNLIAADCLQRVSEAAGWQFAICSAVRDEAKKMRDISTGEMVAIDASLYIEAGVLQVLDLSGDDEAEVYVEQSMVVDDGEAMSIAIAACRGLDLAIDDRKAVKHARQRFPNLQLWGTPEILKHWTEISRVPPSDLKKAILMIESCARYFPGKNHPLSTWWASAKA